MVSLLRTALVLLLLLVSPAAAQDAMPADFVDAATVVPELVVDMRYFGTDNFIGERIDGYEHPRCLLAQPAARALARVQHDLAARGFALKVFDCYRPARAVAHFMRWARDLDDTRRKAKFYPEVDKRDLFKLDYIAERSGHSRGATADLTLVRRTTAPGQADAEVDMGTPFDLFDPRSWPSDRTMGAAARRNRARLAAAMARAGFKPYDKEWWHFTLAREPFPNTYFDFPVR